MKPFKCACGVTTYFDNNLCLACGRTLGFDLETRSVLPLAPPDPDGVCRQDGGPEESAWRRFRRCANGVQYNVCNWLVAAYAPSPYCRACELNDVIPNLDVPRNLGRWKVLENAKRRLVFDLTGLGLPVSRERMRFELIEDKTSNPAVIPEYVTTGYHAGTITINVAEADDIRREAIRVELGERYRTVLGHFRHESGHCYWEALIPPGPVREEFRELFGDEREDYAAALARHYSSGVSATVTPDHITPYATMHPWEDWAESWAHFLHIHAALESAAEAGWIETAEFNLPVWGDVATRMNEVARSLGVDDPYPFVITPAVARKISFVRRRIEAAGLSG
jgi:hypothetical protein